MCLPHCRTIVQLRGWQSWIKMIKSTNIWLQAKISACLRMKKWMWRQKVLSRSDDTTQFERGWNRNHFFSQENFSWNLFKLCSYLDSWNPVTNFPCERPALFQNEPCFPVVFNFHRDVLTGNNPDEDHQSLNSRFFKIPVIFKSMERKKKKRRQRGKVSVM